MGRLRFQSKAAFTFMNNKAIRTFVRPGCEMVGQDNYSGRGYTKS